ncbi:dipeptidase D [Muriicola jejuensis]|uniref:Cytosol non-specific dipeptidase n=1 Tax=Muriicola jejuensis TaxID=504488 RepID=A0A6P0UC03_9FLAO|nr:aminoacyl-histidine dipeptidase [Muriicola jejuensis]NER10811.1 beta-Ala-His dipeptidase [Muriicola jejuensis]SMP16215.1 dipeptidase D [Muriicola jejuensis]
MDIRLLEPASVWKYFGELNAVPRPSKKEERVIAFMLDFGKSLGLETFRDRVGNVIIRKPATQGMESRKTVVLQSHLDMVHQKNNTTDFNFEEQGIEMYVDGDWVRARGTTLGADNGMGVAAIMAVLASKDIPHPSLEALFTIDEETGMTGAKGLESGVLKGEILLNLDTEEDDEIDIGCAGGIDVTASGTYPQKDLPQGAKTYRLLVKGLQGGHSGMDIHRGLGNANKILNRLLYTASLAGELHLGEIDGGGLRNAIPRESTAYFGLTQGNEQVLKVMNDLSVDIRKELEPTEPNLQILVESYMYAGQVMEKKDFDMLLRAVYGVHNGVFAMSRAIDGLVETSNNLARVEVRDGVISINCLTRSSVDSAKMDLAHGLTSVFSLAGYEVNLSGDYPGWTPDPDSEILKVLIEKYKVLFHEEPRVVSCHAGLECGILGGHYPGMDMISFGPTIKGAHSPDEKVQISSVQKFWKFLKKILEEIPEA